VIINTKNLTPNRADLSNMKKLVYFLLFGFSLMLMSFTPSNVKEEAPLVRYRYIPVDDGQGGSEISVQQEQMPCPPGITGECWVNTGKCLSSSGLLYNCTSGNAE
jgi:hypothetical protein